MTFSNEKKKKKTDFGSNPRITPVVGYVHHTLAMHNIRMIDNERISVVPRIQVDLYTRDKFYLLWNYTGIIHLLYWTQEMLLVEWRTFEGFKRNYLDGAFVEIRLVYTSGKSSSSALTFDVGVLNLQVRW